MTIHLVPKEAGATMSTEQEPSDFLILLRLSYFSFRIVMHSYIFYIFSFSCIYHKRTWFDM